MLHGCVLRGAGVPAAALLCLGLGAAGCGGGPAPEEAVARPVKMLTIGEGDAGRRREYPGKVKAAQHADMAFEVPGKIVEFRLREGERAKKGDVLARLDARDYEARFDAAQAMLRKAQADERRGRNIRAEDAGAISQAMLDTYRRGVEVAEANTRQAEKAVEDAVLRAPFDGVMARKLVEDFENVQAKQPVLVFQDDSYLEVAVDVPERDMTRGRSGRTVEEVTASLRPEVVVTSLPDRVFPARIKEAATTADPATRTFQVTFTFDTPADSSVLPGMTAKVAIRGSAAGGEGAITIPAGAALADDEGAAFVWLVDPGTSTVRRAPVELGEVSGDEVAIRSGLSPGDTIAVSGVHQLREGMAVRRYES